MTAPATVELLRCAGCGGAVPLGDGEAARCPYCRAEVPIPEALRGQRDAQRQDQAARLAATQLYAQLGKPPGLVLRIMASRALAIAALVFLPFVLVAVFVLALDVFVLLELALRMALDDVLGRGRTWALLGSIATLFLAAWLVGGAYGRRRALARQRMQAELAAGAPERAGGPATCRQCHAPLAVAANALGARCGYCGAENLVAVDARWVERVRADRKQLRRALHDVASADARERRELRSRLRVRSIAVVTILTLLAFAAVMTPSRWQHDVAESPRRLTPIANMHPMTLLADGAPTSVAVDNSCEDAGCVAITMVALRRGERLTIARAADEPDPVTIFIRGEKLGSRAADTIDFAKKPLWRAQSLDFIAPHSGYFFVWLVMPQKQTVLMRLTLR